MGAVIKRLAWPQGLPPLHQALTLICRMTHHHSPRGLYWQNQWHCCPRPLSASGHSYWLRHFLNTLWVLHGSESGARRHCQGCRLARKGPPYYSLTPCSPAISHHFSTPHLLPRSLCPPTPLAPEYLLPTLSCPQAFLICLVSA